MMSGLLLFGLLFGLGACAGSSPAPGTLIKTEPSPPIQLGVLSPFFVPGEVMMFDLSLANMVGGKAVMAVGEPGQADGRRVLIVRSMVESAGLARLIKTVRDELQTQLDASTGAPLEHRADMMLGDKRMMLVAHFASDQVRIEYEREGKPRRTKRHIAPAGEPVHDVHSALGVVRAWMPQPGDVAHIHTVSGRRLWRSELRLVGSETVRTAMGLYPALRIEGKAVRLTDQLQVDQTKRPRSFTLWLSDDDSRLPLRVTARTEYGRVAAELVDYRRPDRQVSQR